MSKPKPKNEQPPYEVIRAVNQGNELGRLAREADALSITELRERAGEAGVDTSGASKEEIVERVRDLRDS